MFNKWLNSSFHFKLIVNDKNGDYMTQCLIIGDNPLLNSIFPILQVNGNEW